MKDELLDDRRMIIENLVQQVEQIKKDNEKMYDKDIKLNFFESVLLFLLACIALIFKPINVIIMGVMAIIILLIL